MSAITQKPRLTAPDQLEQCRIQGKNHTDRVDIVEDQINTTYEQVMRKPQTSLLKLEKTAKSLERTLSGLSDLIGEIPQEEISALKGALRDIAAEVAEGDEHFATYLSKRYDISAFAQEVENARTSLET